MTSFAQPSFAKGEIAPALYGRTDTAAYRIALKTARNAIVKPYGGICNRPGLQFLGPCKDHTTSVRLIEFQFNTDDTYVIELGNLYARFIRNDAYVTETALTSVMAGNGNPVLITKASHGYSDGDEVIFSGFTQMTQLNGNRYIVANAMTNQFEITHQVTGAAIDGSTWTSETTGGTCAKIYEIVTPYATADLFEIKYVQNADVMTITHQSYAIRELTRTAHNAWTLTTPTFAPTQDHPTALSATAGTAGGDTVRYKVTAINVDNEESLSALNTTTKTVTAGGATAANPVVVTSASHGFENGDEVELNGFVEMTEVNGRRFIVANKTTNTFELEGEDGTDGRTAESSTSGSINLTFAEVTNSAVTRDNDLAWTAVAGAKRYGVYRRDEGLYGLIGETEKVAYTDVDVVPDVSITPPQQRNPFLFANNWPGTVSYYEQRRVFGGTVNSPETVFYSRTGEPNNFSFTSPSVASDAITTSLSALRVNEVRHFVPGNDFLVLTSGAEWRVNSGADGGFEIATLRQKPQSYWGCNHLKPLVIGSVTMFIEENNSNVRSLGYSLQLDGYTGSDLNLLAHHLTESYTIVDWDLAHHQDLVMMCRSDGKFLGLTFQPEQEVVAWTHWDTDGKFKSVTSIAPNPTAEEDTGYFVVERTIDGNTVQYVEKLHSRIFSDIRDCFFLDSGLTFDNAIDITSVTSADPTVITAASHGFTAGNEVDISDIIWEKDLDASFNQTIPLQINDTHFYLADVTTNTFSLASVEIEGHISGISKAYPAVVTAPAHGLSNGDLIVITAVTGMTEVNNIVYKAAGVTTNTFELNTTADLMVDSQAYTTYVGSGRVHMAIDGSAFNAYVEGGKARERVLSVSGLDHLEGEAVACLSNGNVVAGLTVTAGAVTLPYRASRIHVGLPYYTDIETLDIEAPRGTIIDRKKKVPDVTVRFEKSRGMLIGPNFSNLIEMKQREFETYGTATALLTGTKEIKLLPQWNSHGRIAIRQPYPLPICILAIAPNTELGD